jgi:ribosomal protein S18 acetylase RimI-like enzyme
MTPTLEISAARAEEADQIVRVARDAQVFTTEEVDTVRELLDDYLATSGAGQYRYLACRLDGQVVGFACYGPRSLTRGTFDLFWIVTSPSAQRRGVGSALIARVEQNVRARGGRLLIVETSDLPDYEPARSFYDSHGYRREAFIADFYDVGDGLVLYSKRLNES